MKKRKKRVRRHTTIRRADEWIFMVIFVVLLVFFISFLSESQPRDEATGVLEKLTMDSTNANNKIAFIEGNSIDKEKLESISKLSYDQIKQELGTDKDFYIYLEDSKGRMIPIDSKNCLGSSKAMVNGIKCS